MIVEDQAEAIAFLSAPATYGVERVERIDTHGAVVFLAGDRAYKLKRAVRFPYMDFSTCARRRTVCEAEIVVNRRTAPELYERVAALTRAADGGLELDGPGPAVDWVVVMRRFDQDGLLDRMALAGGLDEALMDRLAEAVARFHRTAAVDRDRGGRAGMAWVIDTNRAAFAEADPAVLGRGLAGRLDAASTAALDRLGPLLEARRAAGKVRHCHGDLHLRNICLVDGRPVLFDAIEFDDRIARIDVLYDLAFLLMDLEHRGLRAHANLVLNGYLARMDELDGLAALPLFLSCRAAVRAHVTATVAAGRPAGAAAEEQAEAAAYLRLALDLLAPRQPRLVAIGGLSGTGKSTLARALAPGLDPAPGAVLLRTDVVRRQLLGAHPTARLPAAAYAPAMHERTYAALLDRAGRVLAAGHSVVADGIFGLAEGRRAVAALARRTGARFFGLWLEAPAAVMTRRIEARYGDASDATAEVLARQLAADYGPIEWRRIDASGGRAAVRRAAEAALAAD